MAGRRTDEAPDDEPVNGAHVHEFDALVEQVHRGRSRYTVIRLPRPLVEDADRLGTRRVEGEVEGTPVNLAVTTAPVVDGPFVNAGASLLRRIGVRAGDPVTCRLAPADPDDVPLAEDVEAALADAGMLGAWEALTPATRRRRLYAVDSAASPATRARRLAELVAGMQPWPRTHPAARASQSPPAHPFIA